ncbi:helix-turn-helix domain-containing protein [Occultella glacieicola]|nr:helix-turn-helix domain-containing protein [Occultella glacieicola]
MTTTAAELIGSKEACRLLDVDRATLVRRVWDGTLTPVTKMPGKNGAYVFARADIAALAEERAS